MIAEDVVVLSVEEKKCEYVTNSDIECIVNSIASYHVIPKKGLFTTYKAETLVL